jgi:pilus assembly protein FimV
MESAMLSRLKPTRILVRAAFAAGLLMPLAPDGVAHAAGLGKINVLSRYGQPLLAEIDLINVTREELSTLNATLAPTASFQAAGLRIDPVLNTLRLSVEQRADGSPYVRVTTFRRVMEPYLDLLVDLTWQGGKFQRHYTALVDLPTANEAAAAPVKPPASPQSVVAAEPAPAVSQQSGTATEGQPARRRAAPTVNTSNAAAGGHLLPAPPVPAMPAVKSPAVVQPSVPAMPAVKPTAVVQPPVPSLPGVGAATPPLAAGGAQAPRKDDTSTPAKADDGKAPSTPPVRTDAAQPANSVTPDAAAKPPSASAESASDAKPEAKSATASPSPSTPPSIPVKAAPAAQQPSGGWLSQWGNAPWILGGLLLALMAGLLGMLWWRGRKTADRDDITAPAIVHPVTMDAAPANSMATAAVPDVAIPAAGAIAAPEAPVVVTVANAAAFVDPLDEARVYAEYGKLDEAEKVLREALSHEPGREDIQVRLLEILAERGDKDGFNQLAADLHRRTGGRGEGWKRVAMLGAQLDPAHTLYPPVADVGAARVPAPMTAPASGEDEVPSSAVAAPDVTALDEDKAMRLSMMGLDAVAPMPPPVSDLNFEVPAASAPDDKPARAAQPAPSEDLGLDFRIDFPKPEAAPAEPAPALAYEKIEFKIDTPAANAPAEVLSMAPSAGLTYDIALPAEPPKPAPVELDLDAEPLDAPKDPLWLAVQEKFDLIRAYQEMNDQDGVREVLDEIEREGDDGQRAQAHKIRETLT